MKLLKKMMQVGLAAIFFGFLATNVVFADDSEGWHFVQETEEPTTRRVTSKKPTGE